MCLQPDKKTLQPEIGTDYFAYLFASQRKYMYIYIYAKKKPEFTSIVPKIE